MGPQPSSSSSSSSSSSASSPPMTLSLSPRASSTTVSSLALNDNQILHQTSNSFSSNNNQVDLIDSDTARNTNNNHDTNNSEHNSNTFQYHQQYEDSNMRSNCYLPNNIVSQSNDAIHHHSQYRATADSYYSHCCRSCNQPQPCKCLDHNLQDTSPMAQSEMFHFERTQAHHIPPMSTSNENLVFKKKEYQTLNSINHQIQQQHQPSSTFEQYQMQPQQEHKQQMLGHEDNQLLISNPRNQTSDSLLNSNQQVAYSTSYHDTTELKSSTTCSMNNWPVPNDNCSSRTLNLNDATYDTLIFHDGLNNEDKQGSKILHQSQQQKITPNDFNNNQQHNFSVLLNNQSMPQVHETSHCLSSQQQTDTQHQQQQQHLNEQNVISNSGFYISASSEEFLTSNQHNRGQYTLTGYGHSQLEQDSGSIKDQTSELQKSSLTSTSSGMQKSSHNNSFSSYEHISQHTNHFHCHDSIEDNYMKHQTFDNVLFPDTDNQHNIQQQQNHSLYQPVQLQILDRQSTKTTCDSVLIDRQQQQHQQHLRQSHQQQLVGVMSRDNQYAFEEEYPAFQQLAMNCDNYNNQVSTTTTTVSNETDQPTSRIRSFKGRRGRPRKKGLRSKSKFSG